MAEADTSNATNQPEQPIFSALSANDVHGNNTLKSAKFPITFAFSRPKKRERVSAHGGLPRTRHLLAACEVHTHSVMPFCCPCHGDRKLLVFSCPTQCLLTRVICAVFRQNVREQQMHVLKQINALQIRRLVLV